MESSDEEENELRYPRHQRSRYENSRERPSSTRSRRRTKLYKPRRTEVHRTQIIFGLNGHKAAAERRRFDVRKIGESPSEIHSPADDEFHHNHRSFSSKSASVRSTVNEYDDENLSEEGRSCARISFNSSNDTDDPPSVFSRNSRSSVWETVYGRLRDRNRSSLHDSYHEEDQSSSDYYESHPEEDLYGEYNDDRIDLNSSSDESSQGSSTSRSVESYEDNDTYYHSKSRRQKSCCKQPRCPIVALATAFVIMIVAGTIEIVSNAFGSGLFASSGEGTNATKTFTTIPSIAPTTYFSEGPTYSIESPSTAPSWQETTLLSNDIASSPSHGPSARPSNIPSIPSTMKPAGFPSAVPSDRPSILHSASPSVFHITRKPSYMPSDQPSALSSSHPSVFPRTYKPSYMPSDQPSTVPSFYPSVSLTTAKPLYTPSDQPSTVPSLHPSVSSTTNKPSYMPTRINQWFEIRGRLSGNTKIGAYGFYGQSVSVSKDGNTLAVTALADDEVHVYDNVDGSWLMRGTPIGPPPDPGDRPLLVAMEVYISADGNTVAIGGSWYNVGKGIVRVFVWDGVAWSQMGQTLTGPDEYDSFGICLALSASGLDLAIGAQRGRSTIYNYNGTSWVQRGSSHIEAVSTGFAWNQESISITEDGQYYAIGAKTDEFVLVFKWNGLDWVQLGNTVEPEVKSNHEYGSGITLKRLASGNLVLAVVMKNDGGEVRVYDFDLNQNDDNSTDWVERSGRITSQGSVSMGYSLAMSDDGNSIVTCTYNEVIMFDWDGSGWLPRSTILSTTGYEAFAFGDDFWITMSGNGNIVAIGMPYDEDTYLDGDNLGQVRTFSMQRPW